MMGYTIEQQDNIFIVSNEFHHSIVTVIRFKDDNVLIFSAGIDRGDENAVKQNEVRNAYKNAKKQGLQAFTFNADIWSPTFYQKTINTLFAVFENKPIDPKEKVINVTDFEITDKMQEEFGREEFSLVASTVKLLLQKVFKISTFGLLDTFIKNTLANTSVGKVLSILVKIASIASSAYGVDKTAQRDLDKEMAIKILMFGFTLDPGEDAYEFFGNLKLAAEFAGDTTDISKMTLNKVLDYAQTNCLSGSSYQNKTLGIKIETMKDELGKLAFSEVGLTISIIGLLL